MTELPQPISRFLSHVNARDADRLTEVFTEDASYQLLVPHPPIRGRAAIVEALRKALTPADRVEWEVISWSATEDLAFVERVDRFWFNGRQAAIECTGVFVLRDGLISEIRDYADMQTWHTRKTAALGD